MESSSCNNLIWFIMAVPNDVREFVKENAEMYRSIEELRQRREDVSHFEAQNPMPPEVEKILDALAN